MLASGSAQLPGERLPMSNEPRSEAAGLLSYRLEVPIQASASVVWHALTQELSSWWPPDFHVVAPDSEIELEPVAGGALRELTAGGASLLWYTVQMVIPGERLHLVGHIAPRWGGPITSMLELELASTADTCVLHVHDALVGSVSEQHAGMQREGWVRIFEGGLKAHVEG